MSLPRAIKRAWTFDLIYRKYILEGCMVDPSLTSDGFQISRSSSSEHAQKEGRNPIAVRKHLIS